MPRLLVLCVLVLFCFCISASTEVCTNALIPGAKGEKGEMGEEGDAGKLGKAGPPGLPGAQGEPGLKGEVGQMGKMGPAGDKGDKGDTGLDGLLGFKGKAGTTCDCGRYRKVIGQLDLNVSKLKNGVKFVKNVVLGLRETEERYYLLVKEPKRFREASVNCRLRGGSIAMPKDNNTNRLMVDYVSEAGLTSVYIGVQAQSQDTNGSSTYIYADSSPLQGFETWNQVEDVKSPSSPSTNSSCVELLSTGTWARVDCEANMFFVCEFPKSRRRGGGATPAPASS
ncbi:collectin-10 [Salarias fasciatus]|uniref:C-type lectin domain-containing protein n=1 Tax=Salarias fasciatus TaxID=181472 RepID=A0A672FL78_SALFA|nr:collectin-10 [Salarias fasciatus]